MGRYQPAAVCQNGHGIAGDLMSRLDLLERAGIHGGVFTTPVGPDHPIAGFCSKCGAKVLIACTSCGERIRGRYQDSMVLTLASYSPPSFCDYCGEPHSWASREALLMKLETLLTHDNDALGSADKLAIRKKFEELRTGQLNEKQETNRWLFIKDKMPNFQSLGTPILHVILSESAKKALELL